MEKCRRLPAAIAYFALPGFFPAGRNTPVQTGADRRRQTARAQSAISAPGDRAVKNGLAADAISTDRRAVFRRLGRIQLVTANAGDCRNVDVPLHAGGHRPQDIVAVKDVDIFINQNNIF